MGCSRGWGLRGRAAGCGAGGRHDETDHRDRLRNNDLEKLHSSKNYRFEGDDEKLKRDEVEQEDYQEKIVLQLAEQEEEDLNIVKEESRRRRQAILEKYKTQQSQQQHESRVENTVKKSAVQPSQPVAAANIIPETLHGWSEGAEKIFIADTSFSVGKSPLQNGISAFDKTYGTGGLGEGTPKSERSDDMFHDDIFGESPAGVRK